MDNQAEVEPDWSGEAKPKDASQAAARVAQLSRRWQAEHKKRAKELEDELMKERRQASADERLLVRLVGHDVALSEVLGKCEIELAQRALALVDNVQHVRGLAHALKLISSCREGASRRAQELLTTAGILQGQRKLAEVPHLRRVAC